MMATRMSARVGSLLLLAGLGWACGDKPAQPAQPTEPAPATEAKPAAAPAATPAPAALPVVVAKPDPDGVVRVTANDQMRFSATRIEVPVEPKKIKIELKNAGTLPKEAMGHDLVILKPGTDPMGFGAKAVTAKATDYIPQDALDQIIAHTKLLGPGESETLEFELPGPGSYPFVCTFPGHVALMNGVLVVGS